MELVQTIDITAITSSVTFSNIPQDGTDLILLTSARTTSNSLRGIRLQFNGDNASNYENTGFNYSYTLNVTPYNGIYAAFSMPNGTNGYAPAKIVIYKYTDSSYKVVKADGKAHANMYVGTGQWNSTAAITSMTVGLSGDSFEVGSTLSLYKMTKA